QSSDLRSAAPRRAKNYRLTRDDGKRDSHATSGPKEISRSNTSQFPWVKRPREHFHPLNEHRKQRTLYLVRQKARRTNGSQSSRGTLDRHKKDTESRFQPEENSLPRRVRKITFDRQHECRAIVTRKDGMVTLVDFR